MTSQIKFDEYRFHFRPVRDAELFEEENMAKKNEALDSILTGQGLQFIYRGRALKHIHHSFKNHLFHLRIANVRKTKLEKDFQSAYFENEPSCNVFIWNHPEEQRILIESDKTSFNSSQSVASFLMKGLNSELPRYGLIVDIRKEIQENEFWRLAEAYAGQIQEIHFTLIYPNLPSTHRRISEDIKRAHKSMNADKSVISFKAEGDNVLNNVNPQNGFLEILNQATSSQGSPVTLRVVGYKGKLQTGKTIKSIQISEAEIQANSGPELESIAKRLFGNELF